MVTGLLVHSFVAKIKKYRRVTSKQLSDCSHRRQGMKKLMSAMMQLWIHIGLLFHYWNMLLLSNRKNVKQMFVLIFMRGVYKTNIKKAEKYDLYLW